MAGPRQSPLSSSYRLAAICAGLLLMPLVIAGCGGGTLLTSAPSTTPPTLAASVSRTPVSPPTSAPTGTGVPSQIGTPIQIAGFADPVTVTVTAAAMGERAECLVDTQSPDFFAGVHLGPWTNTSGCWIDSALPAGQTLLAVHASVESASARVTDSNTILYPVVADVTGMGTTYPTGAYGQFTNPVGVTWLFAVPKRSLFSGVYSLHFDSGNDVALGAVAYTP